MSVHPPRPSLPSLNALKAFEAAARHESFSRAASELGVTAAAIAQQIRLLEDWAGKKLFQRLSRGLRLTEEARAVLPGMRDAFDALGLATQTLRAINRPNEVRIAALPSIALIWLAPRLPDLRRAFPHLQISVSAIEEPPNFRREPYDLALFFLDGAGRDGSAVVLADDALFPVCAPRLLQEGPALHDVADLRHHTLLHDASWRDDWSRWLRHVGAREIDASHGPTFSLYSLAMQAAMDGSGVLMGRATLVADALREGRLAAPFRIRLRDQRRLTLLRPPDPRLCSRTAGLARWLEREVASAQPVCAQA
jgi:LysR family glycine cleavage system transcriptional activator